MSTARDEVELPNGWDWQDDWLIDLNRAVDEEGGCGGHSGGGGTGVLWRGMGWWCGGAWVGVVGGICN